ncbi:MAG: DUF2202 domain-containing protein [Thermoanaerobaculia bacterium]|nr:DUF2202 domain-containing protein [Thermoanaerobaculia bacterium]
MKKSLTRTLTLALTLAVGSPLAAAGKGKPAPPPEPAPCDALIAYLEALPVEPLTQSEAESLQFVREEEKLARDAYIALAAKWGQRTFTNIAAAEQAHMDAVKVLLDRYALPDPAEGKAPGAFTNARLQALYDSLLANGVASLTSALTVGATIEDLDIADVERMLSESDNTDIDTLSQNLAKGSRNHLRAFVAQLAGLGITYSPQFLGPAEYEAIVASAMEKQVLYDAEGEPVDVLLTGCSGNGRGRR